MLEKVSIDEVGAIPSAFGRLGARAASVPTAKSGCERCAESQKKREGGEGGWLRRRIQSGREAWGCMASALWDETHGT
eukprot:400271-Pleurochrysis_carterae.AAC.3